MFNNSIDNLRNISADSITLNGVTVGILHADNTGAVTSSQIVNADVSNSAAVAYSKLNLSNSIVNGDIVSGTIADNKLSSAIDVNANANTIVKRSASAGMAINGLSCGVINSSDEFSQVKAAPLNNWGARMMCLNSTTGTDVKFIAGIYNISGTPRAYFGANDVAQSQWLPVFIAPGGGARVGYDGLTNPAETFAVNGSSLFVGTSTFNTPLADTNLATISTASKVSNSATTATANNTASAIVARDANGDFICGNVKMNAGTQTGSGVINYTANRFTINNNGTVYALPNPVNINGTSQASISCQEIVISRVAGNFAMSSSSTTQGFSAATVSSNTPLEITLNYSFATAPLFGSVHCLFATNTAICYEAHFKNSIIGSNVTNVIKIYNAGAEVNTATFLDGDTFRLSVYLGGY
jgi:hypothetical protein